MGKTKLIKELDRVLQDLIPKLPGEYAPPIIFEARSPESNGEFSFKGFYADGLKASNEPAIDCKFRGTKEQQELQEQKTIAKRDALTIKRLREDFENGVKHRNPIAILIDEGQHIGKTCRSQFRRDYIDVMKGNSNQSGSPIIIFGTFDLIDVMFQGGQNSRRQNVIEFPRYERTEQGIATVVGSLKSSVESMGYKLSETLLSEDCGFWIYDRTLGCVGILMDWALRAIQSAASKNRSTVCLADLKATPLSNKALAEILADIERYSRGLESEPPERYADSSAATANEREFEAKRPNHGKNASNRKKPGQRNAANDPCPAAA